MTMSKHIFTALILAATATTAMADISMGETRRPTPQPPAATAPSTPRPAEQQPITWEMVKNHKGQLLELLRSVTDAQSATQAQEQLLRLSTTIAGEQQQLAAADASGAAYQQDPAAAQLEAQLQQEIARVARIAGGAFAQKAGLQQALFRYIPETGYDTSGAHDIGGNRSEPERPQRTAPPLRPMPRI